MERHHMGMHFCTTVHDWRNTEHRIRCSHVVDDAMVVRQRRLPQCIARLRREHSREEGMGDDERRMKRN